MLLLSEMPQHGVYPNVGTYSSAISACDKGTEWQMALALLADMREKRIWPGVITCNAFISACGKGGQCPHCLNF